ncbi:PAK4-inhibitor INKA2 isoform X1 [Oncorhynchus tshawytscha]|uniref:PAK4-inhibitor INKA2 n=2 Tax=Oncorhynchus tshawytscha TaxID=74940 RepID=A0A8C8JKU8_ONCTS|nr:PAK4-inhibitor INKA2 isoform X1 [Oncorhynchus tshawytscha]
MDTCLRRLKQELTVVHASGRHEQEEMVSMKEAGDGLHAQMNSMMGALQELKLLQVQTALEQLDISGRSVQRATPPPAEDTCPGPIPSPNATIGFGHDETLRPPLVRTSSRGGYQSSLGTTPSSSSLETVETESENQPLPLPRRVSGYTTPQVEYCGPRLSQVFPEHHQPAHSGQVLDLPGILYSLSREGPSLDSDYSQDSMDDSRDWTSSLMSRSRNRQPLVLGDNVFADLVGNWLDLPELEKEEMIGWTDRPDSPAHPLCLSRSQEICRKVSLTTNIFKKFLRSVRPDRDKLLKERPGWMVPESQEAELFKRPKKVSKQQTKGSFYLPFWAGVGQQGKGRPCPQLAEERHPTSQGQFSGLYIDRRQGARMEKMLPLFDYNTAVWV